MIETANGGGGGQDPMTEPHSNLTWNYAGYPLTARYMSYSLNSLKGGIWGITYGEYYRSS